MAWKKTSYLPLTALLLGGNLWAARGSYDCARHLPGPEAIKQVQELFFHPDTQERLLAFRMLPQLHSSGVEAQALERLEQERTITLKAGLIQGMGVSGNAVFVPVLAREFAKGNSEIQLAIATSLSQMRAPEALPLFKEFLARPVNWTSQPKLTEEIILSLGRLKQGTESAQLLLPLIDAHLRSSEEVSIRFTADANHDRLYSAVAWSLDEIYGAPKDSALLWDLLMGPGPLNKINYRQWIKFLYGSQARMSSIRAAKVLLHRLEPFGNASMPPPETYLNQLMNNSNVAQELRILAGKSLIDAQGMKGLAQLNSAAIDSQSIYLDLIRYLGPTKLDAATTLVLLKSPDPAMVIEASLAAARLFKRKENPDVLETLQERYAVVKSPTVKAALRYACEESTSSGF